jgi:hypothetical protein
VSCRTAFNTSRAACTNSFSLLLLYHFNHLIVRFLTPPFELHLPTVAAVSSTHSLVFTSSAFTAPTSAVDVFVGADSKTGDERKGTADVGRGSLLISSLVCFTSTAARLRLLTRLVEACALASLSPHRYHLLDDGLVYSTAGINSSPTQSSFDHR